MPLTVTANKYLEARLSILPADPSEKRPTLPQWKEFQRRLPTTAEIEGWFAAETGICVVTGRVSGNLEILDFDVSGELFRAWYLRLAESNSAL